MNVIVIERYTLTKCFKLSLNLFEMSNFLRRLTAPPPPPPAVIDQTCLVVRYTLLFINC